MAEHATQPQSQEMPKTKQERQRSQIDFPYTSLDLSVVVAKAIHENGDHCDWAQLAARLDMAADGGGFRQRLMAAKMFGLITYTSRDVTLTTLGGQMCDPDQMAAAKVESFLTVPLYKAVYEKFRNGTLPPENSGLENAMVALGVPQKQKEKARQAFQRSATEAGFFGYGANRLVMPSVKPLKKSDAHHEHRSEGHGKNPPPPPPPPPHGPDLPPHVQVLVSKLPDTETVWELSGRKKWLEAALKIFDLMYEQDPADEEQEITITLGASGKSSAN